MAWSGATVFHVHWADPTTVDVLRGITERGALPHCLPSRPPCQVRTAVGARSHHGTISLVPLDRQQVRHMVRAYRPKCAAERSGAYWGVPLFVEEVTRLLLERGEWGGDDHQFAVMPPSIKSSLPVTHEASSEAR